MFASILIMVTLRVCYDLVKSLVKDYEKRLFWLTITFVSFVMVGSGGLLAIFAVEFPLWMKVGMALTMITASLGMFNTLQGFGK